MKELFKRANNRQGVSPRDLHIILDALPVPLSWALLPSGEIQFVNRAFKRVFGYGNDSFPTVDEWIHQAYIDDAERQLARERWQSLWKPQASGISEVDAIELRVRCADGSILTVQHRGILLHDIAIGVATFEDISAQKDAEKALHRISFEDPLTGTGNRRALQARWLEETSALAGDTTRLLAVLLIDLDDFKPVNDTMGHEIGDAVLKAVAGRLRECIRGNDLLFRIGGDEFVILLPGLSTPSQVEALCQRIGHAFDTPFVGADQPIFLGATIGAALWPQDGADLRELLRQADEALYRLKRKQKGGWEWYRVPPKSHDQNNQATQ